MATKRLTLLEIDTILQSIEAKQLTANITIPQPGGIQLNREQTMLSLGHLSDERTGLHVRESRYSALEAKEFYPTSPEAATNTTGAITNFNLTAGAPIVDSQPAVGRVHDIEYIYAICNALFAANRQMQVSIWDATRVLPIYDSGLAALTGAEAGLVHPNDELTPVATYAGTRNTFHVHNGSYLRCDATGLAAAEQIAIRIHWKVKDAGGLRQ